MRKNFLRLSLLGLTSCSLLASCTTFDAGEFTETTAPNGAVVIHGDGPMTPPTTASRERIVRDFLIGRGASSAAQQLAVTREIKGAHGVTHVVMEQTIDGLRVHGAYAKAAIDSQGQLLQMIDNVARPGTPTRVQVSATDAMATAFDELGLGKPGDEIGKVGTKTFFEPGSVFYREPSAEKVVYFDDNRVLRQGYLVETWVRADNQLEETLVGFDGSIVSSDTRTSADSYNVFAEDPLKGGQAVVNGPGSTTESPNGWLGTGSQTTWNITGNNAHAYLDKDANNAADAGGAAVTDGNFLTAAVLTDSPSSSDNKNVAVQNLFYLNNVIHDALYRAGFDETAGNFQVNNFGRGGAGNDSVNAEAQDGGGTDNANFATPSDGSSPRMQMYLWTAPGDHLVQLSATEKYLAAGAAFGPALTTTSTNGGALISETSNGCTSVAAATGKVAIIDRGGCDFNVKVYNAQKAGAVGVIIANNVDNTFFTMGGTNRKVTIPSVMVGKADGATLRTRAGAAATLKKNPSPPPQIDGDVDADVVFHEYGHGLTWRMIGSMSGILAGAIGEGGGDTNAFLMNGDDKIGEYAFSDPRGLRSAPYAGYLAATGRSYAHVCDQGCEVHIDGEIYAAIQWRLWELFQLDGLSADTQRAIWVDGMNYTAAAPAFETMRDGQATAAHAYDVANGTHTECRVWQAFAEYGVGVGAKATLVKGGRSVSITESFTVAANVCP